MGTVLTALLAASRCWGCQSKQKSTGLQFLAYLGVYVRSRGSQFLLGPALLPSAAHVRAGPFSMGACRAGWGTSSQGDIIVELNVISMTALASRLKLHIKIARKGPDDLFSEQDIGEQAQAQARTLRAIC